jgi:uncharacterized protein
MKTHPGADLTADWTGMLFMHFRVPVDVLQPSIPLPLDTFDGAAYVSLVSFNFEKLRCTLLPRVSRPLLRPLSDHPFLNLRTYVRAPDGPGIYFIAEWISNRLSLHLGPATYGLPYRLGEFRRRENIGGIAALHVRDSHTGLDLHATWPTRAEATDRAGVGTSDEFLLERYRAYTHRKGVTRHFTVAHEPWEFERLDWVRLDAPLLRAEFPWFAATEFVAAHRSAGVHDVHMSRPQVAGSRAGYPQTGDKFALNREPALLSDLPPCARPTSASASSD